VLPKYPARNVIHRREGTAFKRSELRARRRGERFEKADDKVRCCGLRRSREDRRDKVDRSRGQQIGYWRHRNVVLNLTARHAAIDHPGRAGMALHGVRITCGVTMVVFGNRAVISGAAGGTGWPRGKRQRRVQAQGSEDAKSCSQAGLCRAAHRRCDIRWLAIA
jgi:hypothetical protein